MRLKSGKMKVLIDIGHPAHFHLFKNFATIMQAKGHLVLFTCRDKEYEIYFLNKHRFSYKSFGKKYKTIFGKFYGLVRYDIMEILVGLKFKPDIFLSHGSIYASHAACFLGKPHISFEDTFNFEQIGLYKPFTKIILTSDYDHPLQSSKVIKYSGYHELAYLHPKRFTPDIKVLEELGIKENEMYVILRFVSWNASHDYGHIGISRENKIKAINEFSKLARVFISSETELPDDLKKYQFCIAPDRMHDALAFASLLFGESSTMSEEAAILGVPSIYIFTNSTYYTLHLEKEFQLMYNFSESASDQLSAIALGVELLQTRDLHAKWLKKRDHMLEKKIDVTAFLEWFVENYPTSAKIMKKTPNFQYKFV